MMLLIELVATYAPYIYAVCGLVALFQLYRAWQVRIERRQAVFSYEREKAIRELYSIYFTAFVLLAVMGGTYFVSTTLAEAIKPLLDAARSPSPTPIVDLLPTNTPLPVTPTATLAFAATVETKNLSLPDSLVTPQPAAGEPASADLCSDSRAQITSPTNGQTISGFVSIAGTATHESLQYYQILYATGANAQDGFTYLGGGNNAVIDGVLLSFSAGTLSPGQWTLRLIVYDQLGANLPPCQVSVVVN